MNATTMNTKKHILFLFLLANILFSCLTIDKATRASYNQIVLDEEYAEPIRISLDDMVTYEIIPLETTKKSLLDKDYKVQHIDNDIIIITNDGRGEVFFFGRDGKFKNSFACKGSGPGEIQNSISGCFWDVQNRELYINDSFANRILVFNEQGKHQRTLSIEEQFYIGQYITDFDKNFFLAYDEKNMYTSNAYIIAQANPFPYVLFSKADGKKAGQLPFPIFKRLSSSFYRERGSNTDFLFSPSPPFKKFGDELIICDIGLDNIYRFSPKTNEIVSLFSKAPGLQNQEFPKTIVKLLYYNDKYVSFIRSINYYDFDTKTRGESDSFVYDQEKKSFYRANFSHKNLGVNISFGHGLDNLSLPKNTDLYIIKAEHVYENFKKETLMDSKLKKIAAKTKDDDNDILLLIHYDH